MWPDSPLHVRDRLPSVAPERKRVESPVDLAQDYLPALTTLPRSAEATWAATKRAIGTRKGEQET